SPRISPLYFLSHLPPPPTTQPFPYTTLFRSYSLTGVHAVGLLEGGDDTLRRHLRLLARCRTGAGGEQRGADDEEAAEQPLQRVRSEEHTSELQSPYDLVCRLLLEKKNKLFIY